MGPSDWVQASIIVCSSACVRDTAAVGGLKFSLCSEDSAEPSTFALCRSSGSGGTGQNVGALLKVRNLGMVPLAPNLQSSGEVVK